MLKDFYIALKNETPTEEQVETIAKQTLLPVGETVVWLEHLKGTDDNRKRGAAKAVETRKLRMSSKSAKVYSCGVCGALYGDETEEAEFRIGCEVCDTWFHSTCADVTPDNEPDNICVHSSALFNLSLINEVTIAIHLFSMSP